MHSTTQEIINLEQIIKNTEEELNDIENNINELNNNRLDHSIPPPNIKLLFKQREQIRKKYKKQTKKLLSLNNNINKLKNQSISKGGPNEALLKKELKDILKYEQNNKCAICNYELNDDITYEHIIPRCHGGETSYKNGKVVHLSCNNYIGILSKERKMNMFVH